MNLRRLGAVAVLLLGSVALAAPTFSIELRECGPNKISVIKVVREITGLSLKDSKDLVESTPKRVKAGLDHVSASAMAARLHQAGATVAVIGSDGKPAGVLGPAAPAPRTAPGTSTVTLTGCGPNKIQVIKLVREATGLGLKESKDLAEKTPSVVREGLTPAEAEQLVKKLQSVGGTARVDSTAP